ncbi:MAG: efflux RND transporter periplasmic adaptor subunit [Burkholderiales bacterium]
MTRSKHRTLAVSLVIALAAAAGSAAYLRFWHATPVHVISVAEGAVPVRITSPGTMQTRVPVTLSARVTATVTRLEADVGDAVRRGQLLAVLDDRDFAARRAVAGSQQDVLERNLTAARATVARSQSDLALAQSRHRRDSELQRAGFLSQGSLDASVAALQSAQAALDNARAGLAAREAERVTLAHEVRYTDTLLSFTRIVAPSDGVVILRQAEVGATVVPGSPIFRLADPATLWIAARVDESVLGRVRVGQTADIRLRTGDVHAGKVARIARQGDAATRELEVNVAFEAPPERFAIDQEAAVSIHAEADTGLLVPVSALVRNREGRQGVLLVEEGRAVFRDVETGPADEARVIVRKGLAAGERVVATAAGLRAGMRVRPADAPPR